MRKLTLLTVLLLVLGMTFCFGQDVIKPIIVATATLNWGIDLDTMNSGFSNVLAVNIWVPLITNQTFDDKGTGPIYGQLTLTNMEFTPELVYSDAGDAATGLVGPTMPVATQKAAAGGSFVGKIVATPIEIGVYAAPSMGLAKTTVFAQTNAIYGTLTNPPFAAVDPIMDTAWITALTPTNYTAGSKTATEGTWITYTMAPITVSARIASDGTWNNNTANAYAAGVDGTLALAPITLGFGAYQGMNFTANPTLFYATLAFTQAMGAMQIAASAAFDGKLDTAFTWDASAGFTLYISAVNDKNGKPQYSNYIGVNAFLPAGTLPTANDLGVHFIVYDDPTNGFVPNLTVQVDGWLMYLLTPANLEYEIIAKALYALKATDTMTLTPTIIFQYGHNATPASAAGDYLALIPTVAFSGSMINNVSLSVTYTGHDLTESISGQQLGNLVFAAAITY